MTEDSPNTDILGALYIASRVFNTYKVSQKELVIFSDMYQQSHDYDFTSVHFTPENIASIIQAEKASVSYQT